MGDTGRVALVTGAASGLGRAIAQRFVTDGLRVVCVDIDPAVADEAEAMGAHAERADISDEAAINAMITRVGEAHGGVDILVNCAATTATRLANSNCPLVAELALGEWERVMRVNLAGPFLLSRAVLPHMVARTWGRIINISSRAGRTAVPNSDSAYAAAKAGLIGFTRSAAREYAAQGITINAIAPGLFDTPLANRGGPEFMRAGAAAIPVGRVGDPAELAATASFLASDGAAFVTGAVIDVNGGTFIG